MLNKGNAMELENAFQDPQLCHALLQRLTRALDGRTSYFNPTLAMKCEES